LGDSLQLAAGSFKRAKVLPKFRKKGLPPRTGWPFLSCQTRTFTVLSSFWYG
jgi:hypothetical protein